MKVPALQGIIKRRILANYRVDADVVQRILPNRFRPKLHNGNAIAGICLIKLEHTRPRFTPAFLGLSSENAAHRIAVLWENEHGETMEGVYVPRRDTDSLINSALGGRLFPGEQHQANFRVTENQDVINFAMESEDGTVRVKLAGTVCEHLPDNAIFSSLSEASDFFEKGALGYSATRNGKNLDGIVLEIKNWKVQALDLHFIESSFYDDETIFPQGSIEFDHALLMQNIAHKWRSAPAFELS